MERSNEASGARRALRADEIQAQIVELLRYLTDVPPHHGAGDRAAIERKIAALRAQLRPPR